MIFTFLKEVWAFTRSTETYSKSDLSQIDSEFIDSGHPSLISLSYLQSFDERDFPTILLRKMGYYYVISLHR